MLRMLTEVDSVYLEHRVQAETAQQSTFDWSLVEATLRACG